MVVNLLMMMFLRINSLLRKNLSVELKRLGYCFYICCKKAKFAYEEFPKGYVTSISILKNIIYLISMY